MLRSNAKDGEFDILASGLPLSEGESVEVTWGLAAWMLRRARLKAGAAHGWAVPAFFIFTNNSLDGNAYHFYGTIIARGMALHSPHADLWIGSGRILLWLRSCLSINRRRRVVSPVATRRRRDDGREQVRHPRWNLSQDLARMGVHIARHNRAVRHPVRHRSLFGKVMLLNVRTSHRVNPGGSWIQIQTVTANVSPRLADCPR